MSNLTRRTFFQGAALAASATRVIGANDRIHVGLVGIGGRGSGHQNAYMKIPGAQITGLCDVNQAARERAQTRLTSASAEKAKEYTDMRDMFADKDVDAVSIAAPNHWHALATIWACQAGKDVYVEKPASYNIYEGWRMVEVARKTKRMVQVGSQSRSSPNFIKATQLLRDGIIGKVYMSKGLCFKRRKTIGKTPAEPVPAGVDWDKFLGPAPMRPFTKNRFAYNWHWFWDTGNGDLGNQGVHQMDICRWGVGEAGMPKSVVSTGGKYVYDDDQETPPPWIMAAWRSCSKFAGSSPDRKRERR
jgi:predicted dehydrogenase